MDWTYLIVWFMGWSIGIQKEPESPVVIVHCKDIKKIPTPLGAVSWLTSKESSIKPSVTILGASTMHRTLQSSLPITMAPSVEESVIADGESIHSVSSSSDDPSDPSQVDVTSAPLISVPTQVERQAVVIDSSGVLHPFHVHKMDSGPVRLMTIAHAFNTGLLCYEMEYGRPFEWDGPEKRKHVSWRM